MSGFAIPRPPNATPSDANVAELVRLEVSRMKLPGAQQTIFDRLSPTEQIEAYRTWAGRGSVERLMAQSGAFGRHGSLPVPPEGKQVAATALGALPLAGGILGSLGAGAAVFGFPPSAAIDLSLPGLGAAGGEALRQIISRAAGLPAPSTAGKAAAGIGEQAAVNSGGEAAGRYIVGPALRAGVRAATGFKGALAPVSEQDAAIRALNAAEGWRMPAYTIPSSGKGAAVARFLGGIGEASLLGSGTSAVTREQGAKAMSDSISRWIDSLGGAPGGPASSGKAVEDAIQAAKDEFSRRAGVLYGAVDDLARGSVVNMRPAKAEAARELSSSAGAAYPRTGQAASVLREIAAGPNEISFRQAQFMRSKYLSATRGEGIWGGYEAGATKRMAHAFDAAIQSSGNSLRDREAIAAWRRANAFYKGGADVLGSATVSALMRRDPEFVSDALRRGGVTAARRIRAAMLGEFDSPRGRISLFSKDPAMEAERLRATTALHSFQEQFMRSAILRDPTADKAAADIDLRGMKKRLESYGPEVLNTIFGGKNERVLQNARLLAEAAQRLPATISGHSVRQSEWIRVFISLGAFDSRGAAYGLATLAGLEGAPLIIAKIMDNSAATRWLTSSFRLAGAGKIGRAAADAYRAYAIVRKVAPALNAGRKSMPSLDIQSPFRIAR